MGISYDDYRKKMIKETLDFHGISKWHEMGYTGKGIRMFEAESYESDHGQGVTRVMSLVCPDAEVFLGSIGMRTKGDEVSNVTITLESGMLEGQEAIDFLRSMDVIGASLGGADYDGLGNVVDTNKTIIVCSAGNEGSQGVTGVYRNIGIAVGAIYLDDRNNDGTIDIEEIIRERYSAHGDDELDFATLHTDLEGTSFASPVFCGMCGLIKERYGNLSQSEMYNVMKSISLDAGAYGFDTDFGWGVPILPYKIEILEDEDMKVRLQIGNKKMTVDNKEVELRLAPFLYQYDDNFAATCVEIRPFFEALGFTVTWNASTQEVIIEK